MQETVSCEEILTCYKTFHHCSHGCELRCCHVPSHTILVLNDSALSSTMSLKKKNRALTSFNWHRHASTSKPLEVIWPSLPASLSLCVCVRACVRVGVDGRVATRTRGRRLIAWCRSSKFQVYVSNTRHLFLSSWLVESVRERYRCQYGCHMSSVLNFFFFFLDTVVPWYVDSRLRSWWPCFKQFSANVNLVLQHG